MTLQSLLSYVSPIKVFLGLLVLTTLLNVSMVNAQADPSSNEAKFSTEDLFPSWDNEVYKVQGVAGRNAGKLGEGENKLFLGIVPRIIDLLIQVVAPLVFIMMVFAGLRFIYARDNEEERDKAKKFFYYTVIGLLIIVLSYSIMRALYFIYIG